jgi:polysaccharide biosynthesis protein PslH
VAQLLLRLAERHDAGVVYLRHPGSEAIEPQLRERCHFVEEVELPNLDWRGEKWLNRLQVVRGPLIGLPSQAAAARTPRFGRALRDAVHRWQPDLVQLDHDQLAQYSRWLDSPATTTVFVSHDPDPVGQDPGEPGRPRERLLRALEGYSWRRYRRRFLQRFDAVVVLTERDRSLLRAELPRLNVACIPLGIDIPAEPLDPIGSAEPSVTFVGGYRHPPNRDAALRLIGSIAPLVRRAVPDLRLLLVGDAPTADMTAAAGPLDTITGTVQDVSPWIDQASLVVLPLRLGGGMRVKLLEALACGKAVIASPIAIAGLDVTVGTELLVAESDEEFADAIVLLLRDDGRRRTLGLAARRWSMEHLDWQLRVDAYEQLYLSLIESAALTRRSGNLLDEGAGSSSFAASLEQPPHFADDFRRPPGAEGYEDNEPDRDRDRQAGSGSDVFVDEHEPHA